MPDTRHFVLMTAVFIVVVTVILSLPDIAPGQTTAEAPETAEAVPPSIWCMPEAICLGDDCTPTTDEESSVRLHGHDGETPVLRTHAEDVAMRRGGTEKLWAFRGKNAAGDREELVIEGETMKFRYSIDRKDKTLPRRVARGLCEMQ